MSQQVLGTNRVNLFLECVSDDARKSEEFLRLLAEYTKAIRENIVKRMQMEALAVYLRIIYSWHGSDSREAQKMETDLRAALPTTYLEHWIAKRILTS